MTTFTSLLTENLAENTKNETNSSMLEVVEIITLWGVVATTIILVGLTWVH